MENLHEYYDKLTEHERLFIDDQFRAMFKEGKAVGVSLSGNDDAERAVDACARWIIESRKV